MSRPIKQILNPVDNLIQLRCGTQFFKNRASPRGRHREGAHPPAAVDDRQRCRRAPECKTVQHSEDRAYPWRLTQGTGQCGEAATATPSHPP
jgi:hypothetical protein